jgi:hypothetical protein
MRLVRPRSAVLACAAAALVLAGCGEEEGEPLREGLGVEVGGLDYNVYITRQLNQRDAEDRAYYHGPEPKPGFTYYGVFISVCNEEDNPHIPLPAEELKVKDSQGNEFEPLELEEENAFGYRPRRLTEGACVPEAGSAAASGPTGGALLVYEFPVQTLENRPLELELGPPTETEDEPKNAIELDL